MWCQAVGLNSCRNNAWGDVGNPLSRWHRRLGVISGPPTFNELKSRGPAVIAGVTGVLGTEGWEGAARTWSLMETSAGGLCSCKDSHLREG